MGPGYTAVRILRDRDRWRLVEYTKNLRNHRAVSLLSSFSQKYKITANKQSRTSTRTAVRRPPTCTSEPDSTIFFERLLLVGVCIIFAHARNNVWVASDYLTVATKRRHSLLTNRGNIYYRLCVRQ